MVRDWHWALGPTVDVVGVTPPGRNTRLNERPLDNMPDLQQVLLPLVQEELRLPTILMGYSIGALVAYELALRLADAGTPASALITAASLPPQIPRRIAARLLDDDGFLDYLISLDGMPPEVVNSPELVQFLLPMLRADITLGETYNPDNRPLDIPIACINGLRDQHVNPQGIARWQELTSQWHGSHWIDGRHFFLQTEQAEFLQALSACVDGFKLVHDEKRPSSSRL